MEVAYLLIYGELPSLEEKRRFTETIATHTMVHDQLTNIFRGYRRDAHPMAVMVGVMGSMSAFYHEATDIRDPKSREMSTFRLIATVPTIAAWSYKYNVGEPFINPQTGFSFAENFIYRILATQC